MLIVTYRQIAKLDFVKDENITFKLTCPYSILNLVEHLVSLNWNDFLLMIGKI